MPTLSPINQNYLSFLIFKSHNPPYKKLGYESMNLVKCSYSTKVTKKASSNGVKVKEYA
jgi:hypothetical protein